MYTGPYSGFDGGWTTYGPGQAVWTHGTAWRVAEDNYLLSASMKLHPDPSFTYQHAKVGFTQAKNFHPDTKEFGNDYFIAIDYWHTMDGSTGLWLTLEVYEDGVRLDYRRTPLVADTLTIGTWYDFKLEMTATTATAWYKERTAGTWISIGSVTQFTDPATWANYVAMSSGRAAYLDDVMNGVVLPPGTITVATTLGNYTGDFTLCPIRIQVMQGATVVREEEPRASGITTSFVVQNVPEGMYDVKVSAPKWLTATQQGVNVTSGNNTDVSVSLSNGDVNGDNEVNSTDLSVVLTNM